MQLNELTLTLVCCRTRKGTRNSDWGAFLALYTATAPNGATGYLAYDYEWDKRDVVGEAVTVSDPALLFESDDSPQAYSVFAVRPDTGDEPTEHPAWAACEHYAWGDQP